MIQYTEQNRQTGTVALDGHALELPPVRFFFKEQSKE